MRLMPGIDLKQQPQAASDRKGRQVVDERAAGSADEAREDPKAGTCGD